MPTVSVGSEEYGVLSGTVQTPDGTAVANATIISVREDIKDVVGVATSTSDGTYRVIGTKGVKHTVIAITDNDTENGDIKSHVLLEA